MARINPGSSLGGEKGLQKNWVRHLFPNCACQWARAASSVGSQQPVRTGSPFIVSGMPIVIKIQRRPRRATGSDFAVCLGGAAARRPWLH